MTNHRYYITASRGLERLLEAEVRELGAHVVRAAPGGCRVRGPLGFGYRLCMWSRCASRVLLGLGEVVAGTADELYEAVREEPWEDHVDPGGTLAVSFVGTGAGVTHGVYGSQRIKDAIVDRLRERTGKRPDIDLHKPSVRIHAFARGRGCALFVDLAGIGLHRRGYREQTTVAPLRETLAAGLLLHAKWPAIAKHGGAFLDPMCGGGTLAIEAALMAADMAPGSRRDYFGFLGWRGHDPSAWAEIVTEAVARGEAGRAAMGGPLMGSDRDPSAVRAAQDNATRAGVGEFVTFERRELSQARPRGVRGGLLATNPPYGERIGDRAAARSTLGELGELLRTHFEGWRAAVIVPDEVLPATLGLMPTDSLAVSNAKIEARIDTFAGGGAPDPAQGDFGRRLAKNLKHLRRWASREGVRCFRVYDADIPEYNVAVDLYHDAAVVAEYEAPRDVEPELARARLASVLLTVPRVLGIAPDRVHLKVRRRQRGSAQYERHADAGIVTTVEEAGRRFRVNLSEYLDTGLFLDHRPTRARIAELAPGRRFLNLFCYTGTATVYAATAGATTSTSVDMSSTYLAWARANLELNEIRGSAHELVRADVLEWLANERGRFDLVFCDPPTFSNSKSMRGTFDVQRDHARLIAAVMARVANAGVLVFSTNARRFKLDPEVAERFAVEDRSAATIPLDFSRNPRIHRCFEFRAKPG